MEVVTGGFAVRVGRMSKGLPYPVNVRLPPTANDPPQEAARTTGPVLDVVIPTDDKRHTRLGNFMNEWGLLEAMLMMLLAKLLNINLDCAQLIMKSLGTKQLVDLIEALAIRKLVPKQNDILNGPTGRVTSLNTKRNILVHGHWVLEANVIVRRGEAVLITQFLRQKSPSDPEEARALINPKNQKQRVKYCFTPNRIDGASRDVASLRGDIGKFLPIMAFAPQPQPGSG